MPYGALMNSFLWVGIPFLSKDGNFNIGYLILYVTSIVVATLIKYFRSLSDMFGFCQIFRGFVLSVGALLCLLGLCIVCRGFVESFGAGATLAVGEPQGGASLMPRDGSVMQATILTGSCQ